MNETRRPLDVLEESVGNQVTVELKQGDQYEGRLAGYDQHMNLVVESGPAGEDTTVIRGDNVVSIRP
jgi:small nuclear ribonucleoprotein